MGLDDGERGHEYRPGDEPGSIQEREGATARRHDGGAGHDPLRSSPRLPVANRIDADDPQERLGPSAACESDRPRRLVVVDDPRRGQPRDVALVQRNGDQRIVRTVYRPEKCLSIAGFPTPRLPDAPETL